MSNKSDKPKGATIIDAGLGELDKVRGILFGRQMDAYEARFSQLEKSLERSVKNLQDTMSEQIQSLQQVVDESVTKLESALASESSKRSEVFAELESGLSSSIAETEKTLSKSLNIAEDQAQQEMLQLRMELSKTSNSNEAELVSTREELNAKLAAETSKLADEKLDRESLAMLLDEITIRLRKPE